MSEPVHSLEVLPEVIQIIEARSESRRRKQHRVSVNDAMRDFLAANSKQPYKYRDDKRKA